MKVKNILKVKDLLESKTGEIDLHCKGDTPTTIRFAVYEEVFYLNTQEAEVVITLAEAKKLKSVLNSML